MGPTPGAHLPPSLVWLGSTIGGGAEADADPVKVSVVGRPEPQRMFPDVFEGLFFVDVV